MTARDRIVIVVVLLAAAVAGGWFLGLAPKHKQAAELQTQIAASSSASPTPSRRPRSPAKAKARYREDYAAVATARQGGAQERRAALARLPAPAAAHDARIDFAREGLGQGPVRARRPLAALRRSTGGAASGSIISSSSSSSSASSSGSSSTRPRRARPRPPRRRPPRRCPRARALARPASRPCRSLRLQGQLLRHRDAPWPRCSASCASRATASTCAAACSASTASALDGRPGRVPQVKATISATAYLLSPDDTATPPRRPVERGPGHEHREPPAAAPATSGAPRPPRWPDERRPRTPARPGRPQAVARGRTAARIAAVAVPVYIGRSSGDEVDAPLPVADASAPIPARPRRPP